MTAGVGVPALDDGAAVDGEDVPLVEDDVVARDAVDDHVVRGGADDGGEPVVVQEVGAGAAPGDHLTGDGVDVGRRGAGLGGPDALLVHLGHDLAGAPHERDLLGRLPGDHSDPVRGSKRESMSSTRCLKTSSVSAPPSTWARMPARR